MTALATTETALVPQDKLRKIMRAEETVSRFMEIMNKREAMAYISSVLLEVANTPALQDCTPQSIIVSAMKAATLGLSCARETGQAYLVPFRDHGVAKATLIVGYRGLEQLALRTGKYRFINVARVYEGQTVDEDQLTGKIKINGFRKNHTVIGYCLYFELLAGFSKAFYMSVEDLLAHAERYSKTYHNSNSLWKTETDKMMAKTVLRLGLSKYGYLDPFDRMQLDRADESQPTDEEEQAVDIAWIEPETTSETREEKIARIQEELFGPPPAPQSATTPEPAGPAIETITPEGCKMSYGMACEARSTDGNLYVEMPTKNLVMRVNTIGKIPDNQRTEHHNWSLDAIKTILEMRRLHPELTPKDNGNGH